MSVFMYISKSSAEEKNMFMDSIKMIEKVEKDKILIREVTYIRICFFFYLFNVFAFGTLSLRDYC